LALVDDGANSVTVLVKDSGFLSVLQEQLRIDYEAQRNRIIASANERLSRPLGNGLRSEGRISSAGRRQGATARHWPATRSARVWATEDLVRAPAKIAHRCDHDRYTKPAFPFGKP